MTVIVALMGPAGSGKSSVGQYLVEHYGAKSYSFATPLKEMVKRAFDLTNEQVYGTQEQKEAIDPRYNHSARWLLQRIGTEGCRKTFGDDFWTKQTLEQIRRDAPDLAVIEDCRFVNEANAVRNFTFYHPLETCTSGLVWRLDTPDRETSADATHASESEWLTAPFDHLIKPTARGLETLFKLVEEAATHYRIPYLR